MNGFSLHIEPPSYNKKENSIRPSWNIDIFHLTREIKDVFTKTFEYPLCILVNTIVYFCLTMSKNPKI